MRKYDAENERVKRRYLQYLKDAKGHSEASLDKAAAAIARFEAATEYRPFKLFAIEHASAFKRKLEKAKNPRTGRPLSKATTTGTLRALKDFFHWLAGQPGFKSRISYSDADYFNPSRADARIASVREEKPSPTLAQIRHAFRLMPADTLIEKRDRALLAFLILTGSRDGAAASLKLKHVDLIEGVVHFRAKDARIKGAKTFRTWFFPVGDAFRSALEDWCRLLREDRLFSNDDPLFPKSKMGTGPDGGFTPIGLLTEHWANADPIRRIVRGAFGKAGLPYYGPHSFRRTLALLGEERCRTPEEFKAWSQNLGHDDVLTTFNSYGTLSAGRQAQLIREMMSMRNDVPERSAARL